MIYKTREMPKKFLGLTALNNRLQPEHKLQGRIQEELSKVKAGYGGEQNFDKHLLEFIPAYPHAILHDVCLKQDGIFFQMDSLLITPAAIFIFEVKNIAGKLLFMEKPDRFVRQFPTGETQPMQSPVAQLERKKHFLKKWLFEKGVRIPIKCVVALAYTNEIQPLIASDIHITFAYQIPNYMYSLSLEEGPLNGETIENLAHQINNNHQEYNPFPMINSWGISRADIQPGVQCLSCNYFGMRWHRKKWNCPSCGQRGVDNHIAAAKDWFYLIDKKMTNRQFRKFVLIEDQQVAKRLLKNSELSLKGKQKGCYYVMK